MDERENNPAPTPANSVVTCPSCGSRYNAGTHELIEDTQLREKIAELNGELATLRGANSSFSAQLRTAEEKIVGLSADLALQQLPPSPKRKERDFIVGSV